MIYGVSRQRLCVMLACLMVVMVPISAFAQVDNVATMSDAEADAWIQQMIDTLEVESSVETVVDFDNLPEYDPLAGLSDEQYAAYCQTFIDHPSVLLEYPEGVPQPRFALSLSAATVYVLYLLAAAVGFVFVTNVSRWAVGYDGYEFFSGFEMYMRAMHSGVEDFWSGWDAVMNATWGKAVTGVKTIYKYLKEYCTARMEGYGTEQPTYDIAVRDGFAFTSDGDCFPEYDSTFDLIGKVTSPVFFYIYYSDSKHYYLTSVSKKPYTVNGNDARLYGSSFYYYSSSFVFGVVSNRDKSYADCVAKCNGAIVLGDIGSTVSFLDSLKYGSIPFGVSSVTITPEKSIVDVQGKTFTAPADTITLPSDQVAADTIGSKVSAATDAAAVAGALTGTWDLGETQAGEDTDDTVYPWVPDITGWLEKLLHGIEAIPGQATDALTGLGEKVEALPGSIAQTLENTLIGTDDGTYQISEVITNKFPFCVPFDLVGCFRVLQAPASPPVWRIPFTIDNSFIHIHEELVIDLSDWERPAAVIRFFVLLMFIFGLAYVTRYVVKG